MWLTWHGQRGKRALCRVTVETEVGGRQGKTCGFHQVDRVGDTGRVALFIE